MTGKKKTTKKSKTHNRERDKSMMGFTLQSLVSQIGLNTELITVAQAAQIRGTTEVSVLELIKRDRLKAHKLGGRLYLDRKEVENFDPQTWKRRFEEEAEGWFDPD
jgi:excisionase family DNA binding protein